MADGFAPSASDLQKIGVAAYPTPGQAFALEADGSVPTAVKALLAGYQISLKQNTSAPTVTSTSEASPTTLITMDPVYFDGRTTIDLEFYCECLQVSGPTNSVCVLNFWDGSTDLGRAAIGGGPPSGGILAMPVQVSRRITPTQGYHTYSARAWGNASGMYIQFLSAEGGVGLNTPAYQRIVRAA